MKVKTIMGALGIATTSLMIQSCGMASLYGERSNHWMGSGGYDYNGYYNSSYGDYDQRYRPKRVIREERGYHLSSGETPTSHKKRDKDWIYQNNARHYTIQVGSDEKASVVARKLYKSPRTQGAAQYRHRDGNRTVYRGVVGSYKTKEEAQKALSSLPDDVRGSAKVRNWGRVQSEAVKAPASANKPRPPVSY